ncbi:hypothetical protein SAMN05216251_102243 [Actinacidiphila alni]|uniref:Uncharacterized protein n=1 Tax=Actinacidiphila alni TaxID=380248 RepID=A0A1I1YY86_9ACTN|nr:DUF5324 family protein [Actinacidiphila alni]SFE24451.1 hypothetical protein SAMN05216251_102243 [Actinacidiphila alni]
MTRIDSVRHAADVTKDSVRHAAEVAAPYASTAKEGAAHYAQQAGTLARQQYDAHLADRLGQAREQARAAVPPKAVDALDTAAKRTRKTARAAADYTTPRVRAAADYAAPKVRAAADYTAPKVESAVSATRAVAVPAKDEAVLRGTAALHALRGQVTAAEIDGLVRKRIRRERTGRVFRGLVIAGLVGGAAFAAWKWWSKQTNPDWLVEPSEPTDADDRASMNGTGTLTVVEPLEHANGSPNGTLDQVDGSVNGSVDTDGLDPEVEAKQADADRDDEGRGGTYP